MDDVSVSVGKHTLDNKMDDVCVSVGKHTLDNKMDDVCVSLACTNTTYSLDSLKMLENVVKCSEFVYTRE